MSEIIKLINLEFEKIKKPYFISLILFFVLSKLFIIDMFVSDFIQYEYVFEFSSLFNLTSYELLLIIDSQFLVLKMDILLILFIGVVFMYAWYFDDPKREAKFNFNTYISKFLIIINMIFGYYIMYIFVMFGFIIVCDLVLGVNMWDRLYFLYESFIVRYHYLDFLVINVLGSITLISLIFVCSVVVIKKNPILGLIMSTLIFVGFVQLFSYLILLNKNIFTYLVVINISSIILSTLVSRKILEVKYE